jgi:hypothetical protein
VVSRPPFGINGVHFIMKIRDLQFRVQRSYKLSTANTDKKALTAGKTRIRIKIKMAIKTNKINTK